MELLDKQTSRKSIREQALKGLAAFLVLMIVLTFLSRTADSLTIPNVTTATAHKRALDHTIKTTGVFSQSHEEAIVVMSNIRIRSVNVDRGSRVNAGDLLMELDVNDIMEQIQKIENSIKEMELHNQAKTENINLAKEEEQKTRARAKEEYEKAAIRENAAVEKAYKDMTEAYQIWQDFNKNRDNTSNNNTVSESLRNTYHEKTALLEVARQNLINLEEEIAAAIAKAQDEEQQVTEEPLSNTRLLEIKDQIEASYSSAHQATIEAITLAEQEQIQAQMAYEQYQSEQNTATKESLDQQEKQLYKIYEEKKYVYDSAVLNMNDTLNEKEHAIKDTTGNKTADYSREINQIYIEEKQEQLDKLQALMDADGKILAPINGTITEKAVATGDMTPTTKSFLLADLHKGLKFTAQLTEDQIKYVSVGDRITLHFGDRKKIENLSIEILMPNARNPEKMDVIVHIDSEAEHFSELFIGGMAVMEIEIKSEPYSTTVPLEAVYEEMGQKYLLIIRESASILGTQLIVEKLEVVIQDKSSMYAALNDGVLAAGQKFVIDSNKNLEAGDRVRLIDE